MQLYKITNQTRFIRAIRTAPGTRSPLLAELGAQSSIIVPVIGSELADGWTWQKILYKNQIAYIATHSERLGPVCQLTPSGVAGITSTPTVAIRCQNYPLATRDPACLTALEQLPGERIAWDDEIGWLGLAKLGTTTTWYILLTSENRTYYFFIKQEASGNKRYVAFVTDTTKRGKDNNPHITIGGFFVPESSVTALAQTFVQAEKS